MKKRIAIYPVSANPPTWGHADILRRSSVLFDHVFWAAGINPRKKYPFSPEERCDMLKDYVTYYDLKNITVETYSCGTVKYAREKKAQVIIKGIRNLFDIHGEWDQATANQNISAEIETLCMFAKPHLSAISSSIIRELAFLGENIEEYVLPSVAERINVILEGTKKSEIKDPLI